VAPALLAFAADAGALAALGCQHVGSRALGVAPAQVGLQLAGQRGVIPVVRVAHDTGAQGPELGLGLAQDAFAGVRHSPAFSPVLGQDSGVTGGAAR